MKRSSSCFIRGKKQSITTACTVWAQISRKRDTHTNVTSIVEASGSPQGNVFGCHN